MSDNNQTLSYEIRIDTERMEEDINRAVSQFEKMGNVASREGENIQNAMSTIGKATAAYFSVQALHSFAQSIISVRGEIDSLEISFETLLGSKGKADELFGSIREFAVNTPMTMNSLASGAQTLLGFGIEAEKVMPILQQIGDISMGDAQKFNSLTLAFAQASSAGKLAGQDFLQMVNAGFNPLNEMSRTTGKSISQLKKEMESGRITTTELEAAFASATAEGGMFHGMLVKQSYGIKGALSNLQGAWNDVLNSIGSKQQSVFVDGVNMLTDMVKNYEPFLKVLMSLVATYGAYKAALMAIWTIEKARALAENIRLIMMFRKELGLLTAAQQAFNVTAWMNPYVLLATAIMGVIAALYIWSDHTDEAELRQNALNEATDRLSRSISDQRAEVERLIGIIQDKTQTDYSQIMAYEELLRVCPALTDAYTREELALADLVSVKTLLNNVDDEKKHQQNLQLIEDADKLLRTYDLISNVNVTNFGNRELNDLYLKYLPDPEYDHDKFVAGIESLRQMVEQAETEVANYNRIRNQAFDESTPLEVRIQTKTAIVSDLDEKIEELRAELERAERDWNENNDISTLFAKINIQIKYDGLIADREQAQRELDNLMNQGAETFADIYQAKEEAYNEAFEKIAAIKRNRDEYTQNEWNEAVDALDKAKKDFESVGGKVKSDSELENLAKKQRELIRELEHIRTDGRIKIEKSELDLMEDGLQKRLAQIEHDRKSQVAAIEREKSELIKKFSEANIEIPDDVLAQFAQRIESTTRSATRAMQRAQYDNAKYIAGLYRELGNVFATEEQQKLNEIKHRYAEQRELLEKDRVGGTISDADYNNLNEQMNRAEAVETENYWLETYGDYYQKRKSLQETWEANLAGIPAHYAAEARKRMQEELSQLDLSELQKNLNWDEIFGNLDRVSTESLSSLKTKLQEFIRTQKDLSPESAKALAEAIEKIDTKINERNPFEALSKSFASLKNATDNVKKAQKAYNEAVESGIEADQEAALAALNAARDVKQRALADATKSIQAACGRMQEYIGVATALTDMLSSFGIEVPTELAGFIEGIGSAVDGLGSIDLTRPMSIFTGLFKTIGGIGKAIGSLFNHDDQKEKRIHEMQVQVDALQRSYDTLGKTLDRVYSTDASELLNQQNEMLEQQKVIIQNQINEERSKKHTDDDRIRQWQQQIEDINAVISENKETAIDAIFGEDLKSAIENFADAYADAWANGEDRVKSARATVRDMMQQMVRESIKAAIQSGGQMERIRQKLAEFYNDGILSDWEQNYVYSMAESLQRELDSQFGWAESLFNDDSSREASQKGIATASQDSVDENNARLATIQGHTYTLVQGMNELNSTANAILDRLTGIEDNTEKTADEVAETRKIVKSVRDTLDDISTRGIKLK